MFWMYFSLFVAASNSFPASRLHFIRDIRNSRRHPHLYYHSKKPNDKSLASPTNSPSPPDSVSLSADFLALALSQFEILASSLTRVKSIVLYTPKENNKTGQLEFSPSLVYPPVDSSRVFISHSSTTNIPPTIPQSITPLIGFTPASNFMAEYPFMRRSQTSNDETVGAIEIDETDKSLRVPLLSGTSTTGMIVIFPTRSNTVWKEKDKSLTSRVARSISLSLVMDAERNILEAQSQNSQERVEQLRVALSESLHQVKNPLQAIRTFGKLLQRELESGDIGKLSMFLEFTDNMMLQSDRVLDLLTPMDSVAQQLQLMQPKDSKSNTDNNEILLGDIYDVVVENNNNLEEFSRELFPDAKMELVSVPAVMRPILTAAAAIAKEKGIEFSVRGLESGAMAYVNPRAFQEALANLVDNALKYCLSINNGDAAAGRVLVTVQTQDPSSGSGTKIVIENDGHSILKKERSLIFHRDYRGKRARNGKVDGTGLGLGIARNLMRRMHGDIKLVVDSDEQLEICFVIETK